MQDLLGGKGANLAEMTRVLGANRVPAGFTITTEACVAHMCAEREMPEGLDAQVDEALAPPSVPPPPVTTDTLSSKRRPSFH